MNKKRILYPGMNEKDFFYPYMNKFSGSDHGIRTEMKQAHSPIMGMCLF